MFKANKVLERLEKQFKLNPNYNEKKRFSLQGGPFNNPVRLITNLGYLKTPFEFYAQIKKLDETNIDDAISEALQAQERYNNQKKK